MSEELAIVGSGAIACGLAAVAAHHGEVRMLTRSPAAASRARAGIERIFERLEDAPPLSRIEICTDPEEIAEAGFVVEAIVEDRSVKRRRLGELNELLGPQALLASTTSSLSIEDLAAASGRPERFVGLHVFHPVVRMRLVELAFPRAAGTDTRMRARALCEALDKEAVEVPDVPGFVVNRLLFPYLFGAVRLLEETGMAAADVDLCMELGAGHPMGPLALLDLVGLDVARSIGEVIGEPIPPRLQELIDAGSLGRKSGAGFHAY